MKKRMLAGNCSLLLIAVFVLSHLIIPAVLLAETNDEILERLEELSDVTQKQEKEIERLKKELRESISDIKRKEDKPTEEAKETVQETLVKAYRKTKSFGIAGRVQFRYMYMENGNDSNKVVSQKVYDSHKFDGFCLRRVRLRVQGNITDQWSYHVQFSYDGGENADAENDPSEPDYELKKNDIGFKLQDAEINYRLHPYLNLHLGQFKTRFSNSYLTRGPNLPLCERPLVIDTIAPPTRDIGISIESEKGEYAFDGREHGMPIYDKPIYYAVGLYNGNGFNHMRNDNENFMCMGMLLVRPCKYFGLGASYAYNRKGYDYNTTVLGNAEEREVGGETVYVFPSIDAKKAGKVARNLDYWDFNAALDIGSVHVQAEYIQRDGHGVNLASGYGIQGQIDIMNNFQLTGRYDELDPDHEVKNSFDSRWYTVGYNWFIYGQKVKWQLNYTWRKEKHGESVDNDTLITHFQLLF